MLLLQQLQLWLLGHPMSLSLQMQRLLQARSWLLLEPVNFSLAQLLDMTECLFPSSIMMHLAPLAASAANVSACFLGSAFERHVLLALAHPMMPLPLDRVVTGGASALPHADSADSFSAPLCNSSVFMHALLCVRMSIRQFVQGFNSVGKPSHPQSSEFLKFMHQLQV